MFGSQNKGPDPLALNPITYEELTPEFKQKTAYEIASSDWSSDVCSSDLESAFW